MSPDNTPVIIGIAEICDRVDDISIARDPLALMRDVARLAGQDAGGMDMSILDSIDIINPASWSYDDLPASLPDALGLSPARSVLQPTGGETPMKALHAAADRIAQGRSKAALIVGAEAQHSVNTAMRAKQALPWQAKALGEPDYMAVAKHLEPRALQLGLFFPSHVYPFYDLACAHHWGQTPKEAIDESAALWAQYAIIAKSNPYSWKTDDWSAVAIKTPTPKNRLIAWPYTKAQVANPTVNQAAAVIVTSRAEALRLGIDGKHLVYITGGAFADEPRNFMARKNFHQCPAQDAVLDAVSNTSKDGFDAVELYSCFPIVPKMARRALNLPETTPLTVTGGLSFFGAPLNNYMTHAACAMVRAMRGGVKTGLLYGQGEFVTKHYAVTLSRKPDGFMSVASGNQQSKADAMQDNIPPFKADAAGAAHLETFTIPYDRTGKAEHAIMVVKTDTGERSLAKFMFENQGNEAVMRHAEHSPIGRKGFLHTGPDGVPLWQFQVD